MHIKLNSTDIEKLVYRAFPNESFTYEIEAPVVEPTPRPELHISGEQIAFVATLARNPAYKIRAIKLLRHYSNSENSVNMGLATAKFIVEAMAGSFNRTEIDAIAEYRKIFSNY